MRVTREQSRENILKWVEALESGEFIQGKGSLSQYHSTGTTYCCLGVACEVYNRNVPADKRLKEVCHSKLNNKIGYWGSNKDYGVLPFVVAEWLGVLTNPIFDFRREYGRDFLAAEANDLLGKNFLEIAAAIRRTYLDNENKKTSEASGTSSSI